MLGNGLGEVLGEHRPGKGRFVDLFAGSGAVAWHMGTRYPVACVANDLQAYSGVLAGSVLYRVGPLEGASLWKRWHAQAVLLFNDYRPSTSDMPDAGVRRKQDVVRGRVWCARFPENTYIHAYGGHYFSPEQALWIESLRRSLPREAAQRKTCLASLIMAASSCASAPGHTAQPFQPTVSSIPHIRQSWGKDLCGEVAKFLERLSPMYARKRGSVSKLDALSVAAALNADDLVFIDPPYSSVQYSRFYHVLETIATGKVMPVTGAGRYPDKTLRPVSDFSLKTRATSALDELFTAVASKGASAIVTFPNHDCSNGISGTGVQTLAKHHFDVKRIAVSCRFSTLGGPPDTSGDKRGARISTKELILVLSPRRGNVKRRVTKGLNCYES